MNPLLDKNYWKSYNDGRKRGKTEAIITIHQVLNNLTTQKGIGPKTVEKIYKALEKELTNESNSI
jgi:ERCC4-type nuclease